MGEEAKSKIMEMPLQQRLKYGYKKVLDMLLVSGGISIVAVLLVYFGAKANIFGAESGTVATFFLGYRTGQCNNSWNCSYNDCEKNQ